jgi:3-deoxy-D-manno-octulosonic-acid transferase
VIFIGKSLTEHGGQNIIEPALFGRPVVVGPNMENFPLVMDDFLEARAVCQVGDAAGLEEALAGLLDDAADAEAMGERAARLVAAKSKGVRDTVRLINERLAKPPATD